MTEMLFRQDAYLRNAEAKVIAHTPEGGIVLDQSIFYPTSGGQPGDSGLLLWEGSSLQVVTCVKVEADSIALMPAPSSVLPPEGALLTQELDWDRRYKHMRVHTALHLLSVVIPLPVTGGSISAERGRLDFNMPEAPEDKQMLNDSLNAMIDQNFEVTESWITDAELAARPGLVKTMSVKPPTGAGRVRLVRIGNEDNQIDLQPCGGTHVVRTSEIGRVRIGKVEKKGRQNRRVYLHLDD